MCQKLVTRSCPHLSRLHLGVDTIELLRKSLFLTHIERNEVSPLAADCNVLIEELELAVSLALIFVNSLLCHTWKLVPPHMISFTRLPFFLVQH